jgi:Uma2 family endonuclease
MRAMTDVLIPKAQAGTPPPEKRLFTVEEFERLCEDGWFGADADAELIEGEIFSMASDGPRTISWNAAIAEWLYASLAGQPYRIVPDKTLKVGERSAPKPDFWVYPRDLPLSEVDAARALLAIEVADTSLSFDRDTKAPMYAKGGLRDYWIVDCAAREVLVFRLSGGGVYAAPQTVKADETLHALQIPGLSLVIDKLDLAPL